MLHPDSSDTFAIDSATLRQLLPAIFQRCGYDSFGIEDGARTATAKRAVQGQDYFPSSSRTQAEIGESLGVSQPTISRAISAVTPLVAEATREFVPTADDLDPDAQYILDGTLLPCWSWDGHKELYSGKHKTTGMNLQVACTIYGKLAWISDPVNGSRHDNYCREESGVLLTINPMNWIGDKGYIGNNMITPFRKPAGGDRKSTRLNSSH